MLDYLVLKLKKTLKSSFKNPNHFRKAVTECCQGIKLVIGPFQSRYNIYNNDRAVGTGKGKKKKQIKSLVRQTVTLLFGQ